MTDLPSSGGPGAPARLWPRLSPVQWGVFFVLAAVIAAANVYTTLLIGWGDTGSIVAVLAAVLILGLVSRSKPDVYTTNLGQTMVSAGGSVGFAVASYAAIHIVEPDWNPDTWTLMGMFASIGLVGTIVGTLVRKQMVRYFFPSGTACAVIQKAVTADLAPGEPNRPVRMLALWGGIASLLTIPTKITHQKGGGAWVHDLGSGNYGIGVDPLYYGIGMVVGPRIGLGMILGSFVTIGVIPSALAGGPHEAATGDWVKWVAIAVLTLPTFATILFAYMFRTQVPVPPGFTPGVTTHEQHPGRKVLNLAVLALGVLLVSVTADAVFGLPFGPTLLTLAVAIPLSVVNGRVCGDTDINPVRLVAIVLLSGFFWLVSKEAAVLLGMAVVGATVASVAVDMMQDFRTGHLLDQDHGDQTTVQFFGVVAGALAAVPVLNLLVSKFGVGEGTGLAAPGAQVWAAMAKAMTEGFDPSSALLWAIGVVSVVGCVYAYLTVHPRTAPWMPSLFGIGIGMLLGFHASAAIFGGGVIKWIVTRAYTSGKQGEALAEAGESASNDTMLAGASIFAASAVLAIVLVLLDSVQDLAGFRVFHLAGH